MPEVETTQAAVTSLTTETLIENGHLRTTKNEIGSLEGLPTLTNGEVQIKKYEMSQQQQQSPTAKQRSVDELISPTKLDLHSKSSRETLKAPQRADTNQTMDRHSQITQTTAPSSGMDRQGYTPSHTIAIPQAYAQSEATGADRYNQQTLTNRHRFNRGNSLSLGTQRRKTKTRTDDRYVIPGQRVVEGHHNYVMAYNMITGIRVAVSRCSKLPGPLKDEDFTRVSKLIFDMEGNTMTPSTKYEFKFKDYAPEIFRHLRNKFNIDQADYLLSLTERVSLTELGSPGKSGSFFYYSRDYRFIIKTIHHSEHKHLRRCLKRYYEYVDKNPQTFICQFYGLHRLKMHSATGIHKIHFLVMNNIFPPHRDLHEKYDLKGSTYGRITNVAAAKAQGKTSIVQKDLNWLQNKDRLKFGPTKRKQILQQLRGDVELLQELNIMDYSFLIGIHDLSQAALEDPYNQLSNFDPPEIQHQSASTYSEGLLDNDGGIRGTDEEDNEIEVVYYMGVIDCLTNYSTLKRLETFFRSLNHKRETISAVPPVEYGQRFLKFIETAMTPTKNSAV
ncbi:hypothetical protein OGAPHI_002538 [Ogataea philodendri]|uniref:1-phosphatidylinositol-4-phosphate 5-kinase n=1 Tax=Ogataea philodendri TaxID=1378263 RepID=A0A9P8PAP5_9ASCO|nr:uncharacterized protein OGAPHI_002538 [Ogataea philodendri]KAH3668783.1 hypothetical protein OGAPHI_002538 [Ogataea philodendri]